MLVREKAPRPPFALFAGGCWALVAVAGVSLIARPSRERGSTRLDTAMVDGAPRLVRPRSGEQRAARRVLVLVRDGRSDARAAHRVHLADDLGWNDVGYLSSISAYQPSTT